jgi:sugar lactone lactonase YvrE
MSPAVASADTGALSFLGCHSADSRITGCTAVGTPTSGGDGTQLEEPDGLAISPDGASVYAVTSGSSAIVRFNRDQPTGSLTYKDCISGDTAATTCSTVPGAGGGASNAPLKFPNGVAVSPDGTQVFAISRAGGVLATFDRGQSGALTFDSCFSDDADVTTCSHPVASKNTALIGAEGVAVSPDGSSVYVAADFGVERFDRSSTGVLTFRGCLTSASTGPACTAVPGSTPNGAGTALSNLTGIAVSADGRSVYTVGEDSAAISRFDRDPSGALTYQGCLTANTATTTCPLLPGASAGATNSPMGRPEVVAVSPDGKNVYVPAVASDSLVTFTRDGATGAIAFADCISDNSATAICARTTAPLSAAVNIAISADNRSIYVGASDPSSVDRIDRDPNTGAVTYRDCLTSAVGISPPCALVPSPTSAGPTNGIFANPSGLVVSADDRNVYVVGRTTASLTALTREPLPSGGGGPNPPTNEFSIDRVIKNKKKGTAKVIVTVPGAGELSLTGHKAKESDSTATEAGDYFLRVKAAAKARKKLRTRGKAKVKVAITYTPTGGTANSLSKKVKLVRKP